MPANHGLDLRVKVLAACRLQQGFNGRRERRQMVEFQAEEEKKERKNSRSKLQAVGRLAWPGCYEALVRNTDSSVIIIQIID